jgi:hypothetical protein
MCLWALSALQAERIHRLLVLGMRRCSETLCHDIVEAAVHVPMASQLVRRVWTHVTPVPGQRVQYGAPWHDVWRVTA